MNKQPMVVLVGRTNVGKSTLFNRISQNSRSLTLNYEGVTRDFITGSSCWKDHCFTIVDTGGISLRKTTDPILKQVRERALALVDKAKVVLFLVDGTVGILPEDNEIAKELHKRGVHVVTVVNKGDTHEARERFYEFSRLGHGQPLLVSAQHGTGMNDVLDAIIPYLPTTPESEEPEHRPCKVAIIGKPNVGKSSLMNLLVKHERSIVADMPGTTREALTERITFYKQDLLVTDTAGIRRQRSVEGPIEPLMVTSTLRAIDSADIVLLVVDSSEGTLSDQELKLAFYVFGKFKGLIILYNKEDLMEEYGSQTLDMSRLEYKFFLKKIVSITISCKTGKNIGKVLPTIDDVWQRYQQTFSDDDLTLYVKEALIAKPLYHNTSLLAVRRIKQVATAPVTFLIIANEPAWFGPSQISFFDNILRKKYDLRGIPIRFFVRKTG